MKLNYSVEILLVCMLLIVSGCAAKSKTTSVPKETQLDPIGINAAKAYESGDKQRSLELYQALLAEDKENPVYLNNMGVLLLENGQARDATDYFESASLRAPNNPDYLVNIGLAQIKLKNLENSLVFFDQALQLDPRDARAIYGKGVAYLYLDEPEIALGLFRQVLAIDPTNENCLFMKAYASQKNNLWLDAVKEYTAYLGRSSDRKQTANAYSNRALCYFQLKDYKSGMNDLDMAMKLNDGSSIYYYNRAHGFQMRQQYEKAVKDYTRAISRKANFPEAYINRGELNFLLNKQAKGCSDLKRACDLGVCGPYEKYESAGKCAN